jgi:cation diffusion facilitator CzcD-associated flavoprotein CzcO
MSTSPTTNVAVIGAGPYGLAAAAHLRHADVDLRIFGTPMDFWRRHMPAGMLLRSSKRASSIGDPTGDLSLERFEQAGSAEIEGPVPLDDFIRYGEWVSASVAQDLDSRRVVAVEHGDGSFRLQLDEGTSLGARRVVVAAGIAPFAVRPSQFEGLPSSLVSHSADHADLARLSPRRVIVIGRGQSALESAALLSESGCEVEVVSRAPRIIWIPDKRDASLLRRRLNNVLYPRTEVGPPGISWLAAAPDVFRRLPRHVQHEITVNSLLPMGSSWLRPRLRNVPITTGRAVVSVTAADERVVLRLDDGTTREADHVLLGTGYVVDIGRYEFLPAELVQGVRRSDGAPALEEGFESSIPGLHFLGATAVDSFGPVMRFVAGTAYAARAVTRRVLGKGPVPLSFSW